MSTTLTSLAHKKSQARRLWKPGVHLDLPVDNNNVRVASNLHFQITVKPVIVLLYKISMDKDPNEMYDHTNPTPDTLFDHQITLPTTVAIISDIIADDIVNMATL